MRSRGIHPLRLPILRPHPLRPPSPPRESRMPQHPAGPRPQTAHRTRAAPYWNDSKTRSISKDELDAEARAGSAQHGLDRPWSKLLDEIHVRRLVRNSISTSRSVPPDPARNRNRISRPRIGPQVHRAEIWCVGGVQALDYRSNHGSRVRVHTTRNLRLCSSRRGLYRI